MDDTYINYGQNGRTPRYTEIGPDGEILYQSENIPAYVRSTYFHLYEPPTPRNEIKIGQKTSDQYRTFDVPARFENPDWWRDFNKPESNEFYRTSNQDYGRYKPLTHHMPSVYRTKSRTFTETMSIGGISRRTGLNTSMNDLLSIRSYRDRHQ